MNEILKVKDLVKRYGNVEVIKNASFVLEKGKIYGLLGPNGAGKTTIMKLLTNIVKKDSGVIEYSDDLKIKYLMDVPMFYEYMMVKEYLKLLIDLNNISEDDYLDNFLLKTKLENYKDKKIKELSRGLRQKLAIATVLIGKVDILILDEPISALDPVGRKEILDLITSLKGEICVVFSSHILIDIEKVCDHILLIHDGKIILDGETKEVMTNKDCLLVKCETREQALVLKDCYKSANFSDIYENTLEIDFKNLINKQQEILKFAKKFNIVIEKIEIKRETLEQIFLKEVNKNA